MTSFPSATESQTSHIGARQTRVEDAALLRGLGCACFWLLLIDKLTARVTRSFI
jgi:hypothetical protein